MATVQRVAEAYARVERFGRRGFAGGQDHSRLGLDAIAWNRALRREPARRPNKAGLGRRGLRRFSLPFPSLPFPSIPSPSHTPSHTLSHRQTLARMRMRMRSAAPLSVELGARFDRPVPGSESLAPSAPCDPCAKPAWLGVGIRRVCRGLRLGAWLGGRRIARWGTVGLGASIQSHWLVAGRLEPMRVEGSPAPPAQSARGSRAAQAGGESARRTRWYFDGC